ncbi:uncharacterized protein VDAG_10526 [Verticillium dahliae VdLs.17]|uniref:Uncharacterized protein n=1 Tax=Verticillium dahliae (strain VdLs.17 / ATCC MYA-4575 / FGSC 10137) TaxID=498257 RepID=G2XK44_VERDV|nr:uncharacterized protein VDAG_10526 [Verticillium dahliae VdLs.17]EGY21544.1 hypothetical protein VDAG_10526 [Verticillium dahliae VdLs.17]KAH6696249.1 hypothetical protein EV126DRAFT_344682 [Verticillium dahliae]
MCGVTFACIAMMETGYMNINPEMLKDVLAASSGDYIFVASYVLTDPSESEKQGSIERVFGNLGRSEVTFLLPPSQPILTNTSLHLSFTNYEMPLNVGPRALCDTLAVLVESLVSIMTGANISVIWTYLSMFANKRLEIVWCEHCQSEASDEMTQFKGQSEVISIGSWAELFDFPMRASIVRAYGN